MKQTKLTTKQKVIQVVFVITTFIGLGMAALYFTQGGW